MRPGQVQKIAPKLEINLKLKIFMSSYMFSSHFQGKKNLILSSYHMEPFDIKIECFGGQNHRRQQLSFSKPELGHLFSLLHKKN
jgi:hypothetical protein